MLGTVTGTLHAQQLLATIINITIRYKEVWKISPSSLSPYPGASYSHVPAQNLS